MEKSLKLGFLFIPLMLIFTFFAKYMIGGAFNPDFPLGVVSFVESFTEEFLFRGVLFLFLISKTNFKIAYITSLGSFILMHPQNFSNPFIISTIAQGLITLEICKRSNNLAGAWVVHGTNRFFSIGIYHLIM
jgi:membrane protease YdiL (CAAX protease family)